MGIGRQVVIAHRIEGNGLQGGHHDPPVTLHNPDAQQAGAPQREGDGNPQQKKNQQEAIKGRVPFPCECPYLRIPSRRVDH